jgi:glycosyltransferase involved in cell wall biosynthesis
MRDDLVARGVPEDRVALLPNGVDAGAFTPRAPDPAIRARHGVGDAFLFGYVSNLDHPRENQELLIAATAQLLRRGRRVACLIVGDGRRREQLEETARAAGVRSAVVFTGAVPHEDVAAYYATLDAFVVPRREDRASNSVTPLKPYEALAMARPLVVAALPALLEIAAPEARGLSFRAGDAAHLADQLERLMDDPALGARLGAAGRQWVTAERSWAANGARLREVYAEVEARWQAEHPEAAR